MPKRRRVVVSRGPVAPRPIAKEIIKVTITNAGTTQRSTTLKTTTFPCTITGIRWSLAILSKTTTDQVNGLWMIVRTKDGQTTSTISLTDGGTAYQPETDVLAFGAFGLADVDQSSPSTHLAEGQTKAMRKLSDGDAIYFIVLCDTGTNTEVQGAIQFFCKS